MNARRKSGAGLRGSADPFWWGLAALLSLGSDWLPKVLNIDNTEAMRLMVVGCALFLTGGLVGSVRRDRPWRWAVACFIAFALRDLAVLLNSTGVRPASAPATILFLVGHLGVYFLYSLPVLAGAFLGASIMSAGLD